MFEEVQVLLRKKGVSAGLISTKIFSLFEPHLLAELVLNPLAAEEESRADEAEAD